jgi:hypothetical protein
MVIRIGVIFCSKMFDNGTLQHSSVPRSWKHDTKHVFFNHHEEKNGLGTGGGENMIYIN